MLLPRQPRPRGGRGAKKGAAYGVEWDVRYESLREDWLTGRVTGGVVLVLRQGLLAWVRAGAWAGSTGLTGDSPTGDTPCPIPVDRRLVAAFTELILNRRPEGPS